MKTLIAFACTFLLLAGAAFGAQTFTIPQGTNEYGPVSVTALHRYAGFDIERTSALFTQAIFFLFHSTDGGKTFAATPFLTCVHLGSGTATQLFECNHDKPAGTTHIKVIAVMEGGSMTISREPNIRSK